MSDYLATGALPDEYQQLAKTVADFAKTVVAPVAAEHDANHTFPYEVVAGMADMGLFGLPFPEEYGGMGGDYFALCLALEELGKVDQSVAITLEAGVSLGSMPIYRFGNEATEAGVASAAHQRQVVGCLRPDRTPVRVATPAEPRPPRSSTAVSGSSTATSSSSPTRAPTSPSS